MANENNKKYMGQLMSGLAGAAVGAVATAAVMAMSDKNTREKMVSTFNNLKAQGKKKMDELTTQAKDSAARTKQDLKRTMPHNDIADAGI